MPKVYTIDNLHKYAGDLEIKIEKFVRWTALAALKGVTEKSPVDTGRFKGSWNIAEGSPNLSTKDGPAKVSPVGQKSGVTSVKPSNNEYIARYVTNNLDYGPALENGHSHQAPKGMVSLTVIELEKHMRDAAEKLKQE